MDFAEYRALDATSLAQAIARADVTAGALLELALARHRAVHGRINAVCRLLEGEARAQLAAPGGSGPLAGVPFLIKDVGHDFAGTPTTYGSRSMRHALAARHSSVVRRYLDAGLVIFGKTNSPEFALKAVTDPVLYGRSSNPWNLAHTPGGSSGGAAAAVAAGIVPMAAGNDGGGSIRIPAACCGLLGLRPSRGRISLGPERGEIWHGAVSEGVLSRSVRDTAAALDLLQGPEAGDPFVIEAPREPYALAMERDPGRLRIGFTADSPIGTDVHPEAGNAVRDAARLLEKMGHDVEEAAPRIDGTALARSFLRPYLAQAAVSVAMARELGARRGDFEPMTRVLFTLGKALSAADLSRNLDRWNDFARALGAFHRRYDLLLTPTLAGPPLRHGEGDLSAASSLALDLLQRTGLLGMMAHLGLVDRVVDAIARESLRHVPFTQLANLTGTPAMSVPLHWTPHGLPLGVQFVAPFGREDLLLQLAHQLELAKPWFHRVPG